MAQQSRGSRRHVTPMTVLLFAFIGGLVKFMPGSINWSTCGSRSNASFRLRYLGFHCKDCRTGFKKCRKTDSFSSGQGRHARPSQPLPLVRQQYAPVAR